jgi:hypothetical protein
VRLVDRDHHVDHDVAVAASGATEFVTRRWQTIGAGRARSWPLKTSCSS